MAQKPPRFHHKMLPSKQAALIEIQMTFSGNSLRLSFTLERTTRNLRMSMEVDSIQSLKAPLSSSRCLRKMMVILLRIYFSDPRASSRRLLDNNKREIDRNSNNSNSRRSNNRHILLQAEGKLSFLKRKARSLNKMAHNKVLLHKGLSSQMISTSKDREIASKNNKKMLIINKEPIFIRSTKESSSFRENKKSSFRGRGKDQGRRNMSLRRKGSSSKKRID